MNLIEGIQKQCNRCRELRKQYEQIGPAGAFGVAMIDIAVKEGEDSIASGDAVRMVVAHGKLEQIGE